MNTPKLYWFRDFLWLSMKALLIYPGIDVNSRDFFKWRPLHVASCKDARLELVKLLLQNSNTEVNATASLEMTPLHMAARFACPKVVEHILEDARLRIDAKTVDGFHSFPSSSGRLCREFRGAIATTWRQVQGGPDASWGRKATKTIGCWLPFERKRCPP
jgi:hypothetical protein